jgi:mannosyltransferase OCH1-like enzyme
MRTWAKFHPDTPIKVWRENSIPESPYFRHVVKTKKWGRASDYFRWWVLATYGGTYLDFDVELHQPLTVPCPCLPYITKGGAVDAYFATFPAGHEFAKVMLTKFDKLTGDEHVAESSVSLITSELRSRGLQGYFDGHVGDIQLLSLEEQAKMFTHHALTNVTWK